jgi:AraC-like DNA-binding protein
MLYFENINEINKASNLGDSKHPLIDIRRYSDILPLMPPSNGTPLKFRFYKISLKKNFTGLMKYGKTKYDSSKGVLYFVEPGQIFSCTSTENYNGYQIFLHPDIFKSHTLSKSIKQYNFFSYEINEALFLTDNEDTTVSFLMNEAWNELNNKGDEFSIPIVLSYISTLLNTVERFYTRQFNTRKTIYNQLTSDFLQLLKNYYTNTIYTERQPSVHFFSEKLHVTPNYLSDIIKHNTGKSALNIIHEYVIEEAKILLSTSNKTISEISDILGFEYSNYFSRLFKKKIKLTPSDYRKSIGSI